MKSFKKLCKKSFELHTNYVSFTPGLHPVKLIELSKKMISHAFLLILFMATIGTMLHGAKATDALPGQLTTLKTKLEELSSALGTLKTNLTKLQGNLTQPKELKKPEAIIKNTKPTPEVTKPSSEPKPESIPETTPAPEPPSDQNKNPEPVLTSNPSPETEGTPEITEASSGSKPEPTSKATESQPELEHETTPAPKSPSDQEPKTEPAITHEPSPEPEATSEATASSPEPEIETTPKTPELSPSPEPKTEKPEASIESDQEILRTTFQALHNAQTTIDEMQDQKLKPTKSSPESQTQELETLLREVESHRAKITEIIEKYTENNNIEDLYTFIQKILSFDVQNPRTRSKQSKKTESKINPIIILLIEYNFAELATKIIEKLKDQSLGKIKQPLEEIKSTEKKNILEIAIDQFINIPDPKNSEQIERINKQKAALLTLIEKIAQTKEELLRNLSNSTWKPLLTKLEAAIEQTSDQLLNIKEQGTKTKTLLKEIKKKKIEEITKQPLGQDAGLTKEGAIRSPEQDTAQPERNDQKKDKEQSHDNKPKQEEDKPKNIEQKADDVQELFDLMRDEKYDDAIKKINTIKKSTFIRNIETLDFFQEDAKSEQKPAYLYSLLLERILSYKDKKIDFLDTHEKNDLENRMMLKSMATELGDLLAERTDPEKILALQDIIDGFGNTLGHFAAEILHEKLLLILLPQKYKNSKNKSNTINLSIKNSRNETFGEIIDRTTETLLLIDYDIPFDLDMRLEYFNTIKKSGESSPQQRITVSNSATAKNPHVSSLSSTQLQTLNNTLLQAIIEYEKKYLKEKITFDRNPQNSYESSAITQIINQFEGYDQIIFKKNDQTYSILEVAVVYHWDKGNNSIKKLLSLMTDDKQKNYLGELIISYQATAETYYWQEKITYHQQYSGIAEEYRSYIRELKENIELKELIASQIANELQKDTKPNQKDLEQLIGIMRTDYLLCSILEEKNVDVQNLFDRHPLADWNMMKLNEYLDAQIEAVRRFFASGQYSEYDYQREEKKHNKNLNNLTLALRLFPSYKSIKYNGILAAGVSLNIGEKSIKRILELMKKDLTENEKTKDPQILSSIVTDLRTALEKNPPAFEAQHAEVYHQYELQTITTYKKINSSKDKKSYDHLISEFMRNHKIQKASED